MTAAAKASFGPVSPFLIQLRATATLISSGFSAFSVKGLNIVSALFAQPITGSEGQKIVGDTLPENDQSNND